MDESDAPDPLLQQVPLIRNPAFQPPRPVTLNADYGKILATLPGSVMPPKAAISKEELEKWIVQMETLDKERLNEDARNRDIAVYKDWLAGVQRKVAPGYSFEVMTPTKTSE